MSVYGLYGRDSNKERGIASDPVRTYKKSGFARLSFYASLEMKKGRPVLFFRKWVCFGGRRLAWRLFL